VTEVVYGRTFAADQDPREPWYDDNGLIWPNVFNPSETVPAPYGGWHQEKHFASGGLVTTTSALVNLAETYYIQMEDFCGGVLGNYGEPTNGVRPNPKRSHNGRLRGTSSYLRQRPDGVNFALIFNKALDDSVFNDPRDMLDDAFDTFDADGFTWPTQGVEGQWVDFDAPIFQFGNGSYERPWRLFGIALSSSPDEATLNLKSGNSPWTGTLDRPLRLRAPQGGTSRIGVNI